MFKRLALSLTGAAIGYVLGALVGGWLISSLSSNSHDRSLEAAMTGAFVTGPLVALVGGVIGFVTGRPRRSPIAQSGLGGSSPRDL